MPRVLIVGATSAIAHETARQFAAEGAALALAARHPERLAAVAADLTARGATVAAPLAFDADDLRAHVALLDAAEAALGGPLDAALVAYGTLPDQAEVEHDADAVVRAFTTNATTTIALLTHLGERFEARGRGAIAVISSVAGDRGRPSNYVYGAAKGAVSLFAQGLRARLARRGVSLTTVKPGFVDTPMTAHLPKNALFATASAVGARIHRAMQRGEDVVYTPAFWRPVMAGIRAVPERLFKRLPL